MKNITTLIFISLMFCIPVFGQKNKGRMLFGEEYAKMELSNTLKDTLRHNYVRFKNILVKDSSMAKTIAETILFGIYGSKSIKSQRPYEIYHIDNYWILLGTLPNGWKGGTFSIIINDRNSQVIKISHSK